MSDEPKKPGALRASFSKLPPPPGASSPLDVPTLLGLGTLLAPPPKYQWAYIVSYDLNAWGDGFNYMPFFTELQNSLNWWHYLTFTWIVVRNEVLVEFAPLLRSKMHSKDRLLILPAKGPADGWLPEEAYQWIRERVKNEW
jgi:hypothetical protein